MREAGLVVDRSGRLGRGSRSGDGSGAVTKHKVLRVHGGRLVVAERRVELEGELDSLAAQGFTLVNSFAVDDNVYLVMAADS